MNTPSSRETVLIVEDDAVMLRGLRDNFEFEGYRVLTATDGETGLNEAMRARPDLLVLDLMLPKVNGYEICRYLREEGMDIPILVLTARGQEGDIVLGLKLGADDYVTKPFSIRELLARAEALLRRRRKNESTKQMWGDCELDLAAHSFTRGGNAVPLSPKEYELLRFFVSNSGKALSRDTIMSSVWGYDCSVTPRSIDRFVTMLRQKIEPDPAHPRYIQTVREFGYRFDADGKLQER
jgi:DNA-binding response OmpR family regulator